MTPPSRIGGTCAAPNCYSTVLFSATRFCTIHQSFTRTPSTNNGHHVTSQSGTSRPSGRVLTAKRGRGHPLWGTTSRPVRPQQPARELPDTGGVTQAKQSTIEQLEKRKTSAQFLTRRDSDDEREKNHPFRGWKAENAARNRLNEKNSSIDRSTNAALQTEMAENSAGAARGNVAAQINLPITSSLPETPRIGPQADTERSTNVPREYVVTKRTKAPAANMQPDLQSSREPKSNTKSGGHIPLSLSSQSSSSTAQELPEHLSSVLNPVFARELRRAQEFNSRTKVSTGVSTGPSRPHLEVISQSKVQPLTPAGLEAIAYSPKPLLHAEPEAAGTKKATPDRECHLPKVQPEKECDSLEKVQSAKTSPEKEVPSVLATETIQASPEKTLPEGECHLPEEAPQGKTLSEEAPPPRNPSPEKERPSPDIPPEVPTEIDNEVNMADVSDISDGAAAQSTEAALSPLRAKADTRKKKLVANFDPVAFDSMIYRQSRLRPPPGVSLSSRIVKNGLSLGSGKQVYLPVNPAIHKMHKRSQHWYKEKCEEIRRRPNRKVWFGKVMARQRWLLAEEEKLEGSRQKAQRVGTAPHFKPPEPRRVKQILDFGDVPEEELPEHVRSNPTWLKACAWLRDCEEKATQHQRHVDKSRVEAERYFEKNCGAS